jgi:hypothetical protein
MECQTILTPQHRINDKVNDKVNPERNCARDRQFLNKDSHSKSLSAIPR